MFALLGPNGAGKTTVTKYRGWYHHVTLALLALAFLKAVQREWGKKGTSRPCRRSVGCFKTVLPVEPWTPAIAIAWWRHQQRRKAASRASHRRRWIREHPIPVLPAL